MIATIVVASLGFVGFPVYAKWQIEQIEKNPVIQQKIVRLLGL
jgi:uncharacterized protein YneF (UPF0154 family)